MTNDDLFAEYFDLFECRLDKIEPLPMREIPMKNGTIMHGATSVYGDGNQKNTRKNCLFPQRLNINSSDSKLDELDCNAHVCENEPQGGNGTTKGFLSCVTHTRTLVDAGLHPLQIDQYLIYMDILQKLSILHATNNTQKRTDEKRTKLENQLNKISDTNRKTFEKITESFQSQNLRRSSRITNETKKKIHDTMNQENKTENASLVQLKIYIR